MSNDNAGGRGGDEIPMGGEGGATGGIGGGESVENKGGTGEASSSTGGASPQTMPLPKDAGATLDAALPQTPTGAASELALAPGAEGDFDFSDKKWIYSEHWKAKPGDVADKVVQDTISSRSSYPGRLFKYAVQYPASYDGKTPAALMVWQDGGSISGGGVTRLYSNMGNSKLLPLTVNLFVSPSSTQNRSDEYDSVDDRYVKFLIDELIPEASRKHGFVITSSPEGRGIGGVSSGGAAAFTAAWLRPEYFRRVLTCNGSFVALKGADRYPALIRSTNPSKPLRVFLLSGDQDLPGLGGWYPANQRMAAALKERGYHYRFVFGKQVRHDYSYCFWPMPYSLEFLWQGYSASKP